MSCTIYGNKTLNEINVDDMVDNNNDIIYPINERYFARFTNARNDILDDPKPALAAFAYNDKFNAVFAKVLPKPFNTYWDGWNTTEEVSKALDEFVVEFETFTKTLK